MADGRNIKGQATFNASAALDGGSSAFSSPRGADGGVFYSTGTASSSAQHLQLSSRAQDAPIPRCSSYDRIGLASVFPQFFDTSRNRPCYVDSHRSRNPSLERLLRLARGIFPSRNSSHKSPSRRRLLTTSAILIASQVKHDVKARLTLASSGSSGGESQRTHIQVLANSAVASALILLHYRQLLARAKSGDASQACWRYGEDLLVIGIVGYGYV